MPLINSDGLETGEYALVNGLYGAVDMISPDEAAIISRAMNDPSQLEALNPSRTELLTERGHITLNDKLEDEDLRIISRINTIISRSISSPHSTITSLQGKISSVIQK